MNYLITLILINIITIINCFKTDVCYDDYGCFTTRPPFGNTIARPISLLPQEPSQINTQFLLYNRKTQNEVISKVNLGRNFKGTKPVKIIAHGFLNKGDQDWIIDMKDALLSKEDVNVIVVDWSEGNGLPYTLAVANTQIVGVEIAKLIEKITSVTKLTVKNFHLIGHSLGMFVFLTIYKDLIRLIKFYFILKGLIFVDMQVNV